MALRNKQICGFLGVSVMEKLCGEWRRCCSVNNLEGRLKTLGISSSVSCIFCNKDALFPHMDGGTIATIVLFVHPEVKKEENEFLLQLFSRNRRSHILRPLSEHPTTQVSLSLFSKELFFIYDFVWLCACECRCPPRPEGGI